LTGHDDLFFLPSGIMENKGMHLNNAIHEKRLSMQMNRVDNYTDPRFDKNVLYQHGAYLIDDEPYEVEIIDSFSAIVRGKNADVFPLLIDEFRFHAPQIRMFLDADQHIIKEYPEEEILDIELCRIQPSQFFIDADKLKAVETFIQKEEDIIIQVLPYQDRSIRLDGHTRLYLAVQRGFAHVKAVVSETDDLIYHFVDEANRRNIFTPEDMILLSHDEYVIQWDKYCDMVFEKAGGLICSVLTD